MLYSRALRGSDFLLYFAVNRSHQRISQFRHISLCYLQLSCCLGLYFGTLTFILLNLEWKVLYWLGVWFFFKLRFAASRSHQRISQFQHIYFHSLHFFEGWYLKYATCILFWHWLCSLINQSPHLVAGLCVCTSKQEILLIRAEAFIMVIVCGTVKFGTSYWGERFFAHNYC